MKIADVYRKYYRKLVVVPALLFLLMLFFLPSVELGIDFTGGISVSFAASLTLSPDVLAENLKRDLRVGDISVTPVAGGYIVELSYPPELEKAIRLLERWKEGDERALSELNDLLGGEIRDINNVDAYVAAFGDRVKERIIETIKKYLPDAHDFVVQDIVPVLGEEFWNLMLNVAFWAVVLLLVVVLVYFRHPVPIVIMLVSALFDGLSMLAFMGLSDIPLTLATMAVLLMMVGYSIDTDVVASTFVFKRRKEGDVFEQAERAFKTGVTMSLSTLIAMIVIYAVGFLTRNVTVIRIANVMVFGVLADLIITWLFNTPLLIWAGERRASAA